MTGPLSIPSTLDRVALLHKAAKVNPGAQGLIHCEDEVYLAALLGCVMGVRRYPVGQAAAGYEPNIFFGGGERFSSTRPIRKQMDEVARAVRWQRIAPAFTAEGWQATIDDTILWDHWKFGRGETWFTEIVGTIQKQGAPARVARNLPLPAVKPANGGAVPYVLASRFPNGAVAVGTLGRKLVIIF